MSQVTTSARIRALDLFAGTGWGVACKWLGIAERGVEIMEEAVQTRTANGMETIYRDVWDGLQLTEEEHRRRYGSYGLLIASPPCQTFSLAGHGAGRAAMDEVLEAIAVHAYKDADALREFGDKHDPRTALVLSPLAYVWRDRPRLVAMEQVPTVLPVWEACAEVMREWGYEVKVEVLNAEQYGVPQTRRRAILVARRGGPVHLPVPTHSRYYSRTPDKLDPGVKRWVSMAEALGWDRDGVTFTQNNKQAHQSVRALDRPAPTVTAGHDSGNRGFMDGDAFTVASPEEVAALQSYPVGLRPEVAAWKWVDAPATTVQGDPRITAREHHYHGEQSKTSLKLTEEEASALQSYPAGRGLTDRPSPTITGGGTETGGAERLSTGEAGALQSYPPEPEFVWCGTKSKKFLQIGNAVPPVLAEAVLAALVGIRPGR